MFFLSSQNGITGQGLRPQGLFALRPAPIQIFHQEFLGTSGATYVDYHISDIHTSPPEKDYLYTEKLIYLPNHFFSKGHAVMPEIAPPRIKYDKRTIPYKTGTGSPQENRCLSPASTNNTYSDTDVSFVFCNFHKFLKVSSALQELAPLLSSYSFYFLTSSFEIAVSFLVIFKNSLTHRP